jgi:hypothetical protein
VGNDSMYDWTVPETTSYECLIRITGYDIAGNTNFDTSDNVFAIGQIGIEELVGIPKHFAMNIISSNPFIENLNLKLQIPNKMSVKIATYDVRGRLVENIIDAEFAPGYYTVSWENRNTPAGIYFLYINAGDYKTIEKIIKLR